MKKIDMKTMTCWEPVADMSALPGVSGSDSALSSELAKKKSILPISVETFVASMKGLTKARAVKYVDHFNAACVEYEIDTPERLAAFVAQIGHESVALAYFVEIASGEAYDTGKLAIKLGNTPEADGDGQRYKGRGVIQITGRANYEAAGKALGVDLLKHPEKAAEPELAFRIAGWYWNSRKLSELADLGTLDAFDKITVKINGGYNGKKDRDERLVVASKVFGVEWAA